MAMAVGQLVPVADEEAWKRKPWRPMYFEVLQRKARCPKWQAKVLPSTLHLTLSYRTAVHQKWKQPKLVIASLTSMPGYAHARHQSGSSYPACHLLPCRPALHVHAHQDRLRHSLQGSYSDR